MKLTPKQKAFADYYIELGNATEAAKQAGYKQPHVQGSQNLEKLSVKTYIDERMKEIESKRIMSAQEAIELLTSIARGEIMDSVVVSGGWGYEVIEKPPDINQRKDAAKELLKRYPTSKQEELKEQLLEQQIQKTKAEIKQMTNETDTSSKIIIVNDKEEMRRLMNERRDSEHS